MKKRLFIIAALAIALVVCLGSCKKKTVEPTSDPEPTTVEDEDLTCKHDSLVHVYALTPTGEENGCIEHYACAYCGATFADESATIPVENTILWATNYAFDYDNIIEKDFVKWSGDEPYLLRACRGNLGGVGGEGTIVNDFNGWEDWTEAEWQAYWEKMSEYYIECGGEGEFNVVTVPAASIFSIFINNIINKKDLGNIAENIASFFLGDDGGVNWAQINGKLDTIMKQLDNIQNSINAITDMVKVDRYRIVMQQRYEKLVGLMNLTYDYFNPILRLIAAEGDTVGYNKLSAATKEKIKNLTEAWHNTPVGGTTPELELMNLLQFISGDSITNRILPQVYDYIAKHDAAWEHQGNAFREMARGGDAVLVAECYLMNLMYYETHREETFIDPKTGKPTFMHQNTMNLMMMDYAKALNSNPIEYHDYYVCLIPSANVKLKKQLRRLELYELIKGNNKYRELRYNNCLEAMNKLGVGEVYPAWFRVVYQYYKAKEPSSTSKTFLYDKLIEVGYKELGSGTLIAYDSKNYTPDYYIWSRKIKRCAFVFAKYWFGYRTCVDNNDAKLYECKVIENMTIGTVGSWTPFIDDLGQKVMPERTWYGFERIY